MAVQHPIIDQRLTGCGWDRLRKPTLSPIHHAPSLYDRWISQRTFGAAAPPDTVALQAYRAAIFGAMLTVLKADRLTSHYTAHVCS